MNREDVELSPWRYSKDKGKLEVYRHLTLYRMFYDPENYKFTMRLGKSQYVLEVYDYGNDSGKMLWCDSFVDLLNKAEEEIDKIIDAMYDDRRI